MAKGSVRKKGKKWYYRFYVEDESGRQVQREFAGTESKSETESLLRKAMEDYEAKKFVAKSENTTVAMLLDTCSAERKTLIGKQFLHSLGKGGAQGGGFYRFSAH